MTVSESDLAAWHRDGAVQLEGVLPATTAASLSTWADDLAADLFGHAPSPILRHFEQTDGGPVVARTENLVPNHAGIADMVTAGVVPRSGGALLGEPIVLYKEKINYKLPGGAGFRPHQDATAYKFVDRHLTCMIAIDPVTVDNGCLEVADGHHDRVLPTDDDGCIEPATAAELEWRPVEMEPGDMLWFHSLTPHRSAPNHSDRPRRALFLTFNAAAHGDLRTAYYSDKIEVLRRRTSDDRTRVSTIGHFDGRAVPGT